MESKFERRYGLFTAICLVVGIVIGSGVFFKAQEILEKTGGNMPLGIIAWIIGGLVMLSCVLAFSLMAQKYEKVNGVVDYAEATLGKSYAYFLGWFMTVFYYPTLTMALSWLSARYTLVFITSVNPDFPLLIPAAEGGCAVGPECMVLALLYMVLAFSTNALSPRLAGKLQVSTTIIKLIPLSVMAVGGIVYGIASGGLMLGCSRGVYSLAARNEGPKPEIFGTIDQNTNMATNSAVFGLITCAVWLVYFFFSNLAGTWSGVFVFDPTELPILTMYALYIPIFVAWIAKSKEENIIRRFIIPIIAIGASIFMIYATILAHGAECIWYLIVFGVLMFIGALVKNPKRNS